VSENRSLDEFDAGPETESAADDGDGTDRSLTASDGDGDPSGPERPSSSDAAPATPTMRRTPAGADCGVCGETVERRWHDDGAFVCTDCKEW